MPDETNKDKGNTIPARLHVFIVADEVLPSAKVVRKIAIVGEGSPLLTHAGEITSHLLHPEWHGFRPANPQSPLSIGRHAMGMEGSKFLSASKHPLGAPRIEGEPFWIDVNKARAAGVTFHDTEAIMRDLDRIQLKTRNIRTLQTIERTRWTSFFDREVLIEGAVPAAAVKGALAMGLTRTFQFVSGVGLLLTAYNLEQAGLQSIHQHSVRPFATETVRQGGGWGGALVGARIGGALGGAIGIETGPGAAITAVIGAGFFGAIGYFGCDWLQGYISESH